MNARAKLAALAPVSLGLWGLTELHYVIRHFSTIAEMAAAVTVGAAIWARTGRKDRQEESASSESASWSLPASQALPPGQRFVYPASEEVRSYHSR